MPSQSIEIENRKFTVEYHSELETNFWQLYSHKKWEYAYLKFMLDNRNGNVFLDIGSWIGPVSLLMAGFYRKVISIDLDPVANKAFKRNLEINNITNVELHELGFSDSAGSLELSTQNLGSSKTSLYDKVTGDVVPVNLVRLDTFFENHSDKSEIGFIKIDCEGAEYKFLDQVYGLLRKRKLRVLVSYHPFVLDKPRYYIIKLSHWFRQLFFRRRYFLRDGTIIVKEPFQPVFRLTDNFPMADVLESI